MLHYNLGLFHRHFEKNDLILFAIFNYTGALKEVLTSFQRRH